MRYFYDENGKYIGANQGGEPLKGSAGFTMQGPEAGQVWDGEKWTDKKTTSEAYADYVIQVIGYDLNRTKAALRMVKDQEKKAILEAHLVSLGE